MVSYIIRRVLWLIPVFIAVSGITFLLMHAVPGGPWDTMTPRAASAQFKAAVAAKYGLDLPLPVQYWNYIVNAARGDLGPSYSQPSRTVNQIIGQGFPITASLGLGALVLAIIVGIPLGLIAALRHNGIIDRFSLFFVTVGISIPNFVLAIVLIILFAVVLHILPTQFQRNQWQSWILPIVVLSLGPVALLARLTRSATLDVLNEDYVRTARAKGLSASMVNRRHVLRNALVPVITLIGPLTAGLITGSFVVEKIFGIPGVGLTFVTSVNKRDYELMMGTALFYTLIVVIFNLAVDLTYSFIDPRITRS